MTKAYILINDCGNILVTDTLDGIKEATSKAKELIEDGDDAIYVCEAIPVRKISLKPIEETVCLFD